MKRVLPADQQSLHNQDGQADDARIGLSGHNIDGCACYGQHHAGDNPMTPPDRSIIMTDDNTADSVQDRYPDHRREHGFDPRAEPGDIV